MGKNRKSLYALKRKGQGNEIKLNDRRKERKRIKFYSTKKGLFVCFPPQTVKFCGLTVFSFVKMLSYSKQNAFLTCTSGGHFGITHLRK